MHFNHYGGSAAVLATALANFCLTRDVTDDPEQLRLLLREHDIHTDVLHTAHAAALSRWADSLRRAYGETSLDRQVAVINDLLEKGACRPVVSRHGGRFPHLHYFPEHPEVVTRVRAQTAAGLAHALCDAGGARLGRCDRDGCGVVYVDTSRNARRRFCSLRCANRVRVAAHRGRVASPERGGSSAA